MSEIEYKCSLMLKSKVGRALQRKGIIWDRHSKIKAQLTSPGTNPSKSQYPPGTQTQSRSFNKVEDQLRICIPSRRQTPSPVHTMQYKSYPDLMIWLPQVLVEHARWLRLACCTGLVASGFGLTCKVAKTCMLYWFSCLGFWFNMQGG
jgi:hypothetical protein